MKKVGIIICCLILLTSCSNTHLNEIVDGAESTPVTAGDEITVPTPVLPIDNATDITSCFSEEKIGFSDETEKLGLILDCIDTTSFAQSEDTVSISKDGVQTMAVHCTWKSPARTLYIGFASTIKEDYYTLQVDGGAVAGTVDLDSIPDGDYHVIMYSSDNENVTAAMLYQFK